jgi:hypothetical protein
MVQKLQATGQLEDILIHIHAVCCCYHQFKWRYKTPPPPNGDNDAGVTPLSTAVATGVAVVDNHHLAITIVPFLIVSLSGRHLAPQRIYI